MTKLTWDNIGEHYFELGVDRGVFYGTDGVGIAWNGLISVTESPSGGSPTAYYLDGVKYLNLAARKEFGGTISAYTYPDAFIDYDGWSDLGTGLMVDEQQYKSFGLSYRTLIGNDVNGLEHNYKIHIVYNAMVSPSSRSYVSLSEEQDPLTFDWSFTTTPVRAVYDGGNLMPISHVVIDPLKSNPTQMRFIEQYLYGTASREPMLPPLDQLLALFKSPLVTLTITPDPVTGLSTLTESNTVNGDLRGRLADGRYVAADYSRLFETTTSGFYTLEL
jgi:hypothetical protein